MLIKEVRLINFMSHKNTILKLSSGINVLVGRKGSGKTGVVEAIRLAFGGLGRARHKKISDFIRFGENEAKIVLILNNEVILPNGKRIRLLDELPPNADVVLERIIRRDNSNIFRINGRNVTRSFVKNILNKVNIDAENNLFFLPQERVNEWVTLAPKDRLDLLLQSMGLYYLKEKIEKAKQMLKEKETERKRYLNSLNEWLKRLEEEEKNFVSPTVARESLFNYYVLKLAYLYKKKLNILTEINKAKNELRKLSSKKRELDEFLKNYSENMSRIDKKLDEIKIELDKLISREKPAYEYQIKTLEEKVIDYQATLADLESKYEAEISILNEVKEKWGTDSIDELNELIDEKTRAIKEIESEMMNNEYMVEILTREDEIRSLRERKKSLKQEIDRSRNFLSKIFKILDPLGAVEFMYNELAYKGLSEEVIGPLAVEIKINLPKRLLLEYAPAIENAIGLRLLSSFIALNRRAFKKALNIAKKKRYGHRISIYLLESSELDDVSHPNAIELAKAIVREARRRREKLKNEAKKKLGQLSGAIALWLCDILDSRPEVLAIIESYNWNVPIVVDVESAIMVMKELGLRKAVTLEGEVIERRKDPLTGISIFMTKPSPTSKNESVLVLLSDFDVKKFREYEAELLDEIRDIELEIRRLSDEIQELRENLPEIIKNMIDRKRELENQIMEIKQDIVKINVVRSRLSELPKERNKIIEAINLLQKRIDEMNSKIAQIEERISILKEEEKNLLEKKEELGEKYVKVLSELRELEQKLRMLPVKIYSLQGELNVIDEQISEIKEEIQKTMFILKKLNYVQESDYMKLINDTLLQEVEKVVKTSDIEDIETRLKILERRVTKYRDAVLEAEKHLEKIEAIKRKIDEIRGEIVKLEEEMEKIKKFYEDEFKALVSEVRKRLRNINSAYKELLSFFGYNGWISLKKKDEENLLLEVTIDINRDSPIEISKGGFSSGEKTFAIISLILSIIKTTATPFYIFDEFDVFLDDKSLVEIISLMKNILKGVQCILTTTHRDILIENADKLFYLNLREDDKVTEVLEVDVKEIL